MKLLPWIIALLLSSCIRDVSDLAQKASKTKSVSWSPEIAIPLVYSSLGMDDVVEVTDQYARSRTENDGSITLIYESTLFSLKAEDAFTLNNQTLNEAYTLSATQAAALDATGSLTFQIIRELDFGMGGNELDSLLLKAGNWNLQLSTDIQHHIQADLTILHTEQNGQNMRNSVTANYSGTSPNTASNDRNIGSSAIDLSRGSNGHSQLVIQFDVTVSRVNGNPISAGEYVNFGLLLSNMEFSLLKGYLPNANLSNGNDSLYIDIFKNNEGGSFTLVDPKIHLKFINSLGTSLRVYLNEFRGVHQNGNAIDLLGYPNQFDFFAAPYRGGAYRDSLSLDRNNSNLASYIDNKPYTNVYEYGIFTNPLNQQDRVWVLDTSVLQCDVELDFPLHGTAKDYSLESSAAINLDNEFDEFIASALMRLHSENGFPIDVALQVYMEDSVSGQILDSLFYADPIILASSEIDQNGRTTMVHPLTKDIEFDQDRIQLLKQANRLRYVAYFNTIDQGGFQPDVKFFEDYHLLIQFGIQAKLEVEEEL